MTGIDCDYLVVGAGASGMAFTDEVVSHSDAEVVLVDRRDRPGGHWVDAYPFVRLHQPSAWYGVSSRPLGHDRIDTDGPNAGFYERATAAEVCDYYGRVLNEQFLPSGRVRWYGLHSFEGKGEDGYRLVSRLTGEEVIVRPRRRLVDATYIEATVSSRHNPPFEVDEGVRLIAPHFLPDLAEPAERFFVIGAGKTAMDTVVWLIEHGVDPDAIGWIRPRDSWVMDRSGAQPKDLLLGTIDRAARELQAAAAASDLDDLFRRIEDLGVLARLDPDVEPGFWRGSITSTSEREAMRQVTNVVRHGYVGRIGTNQIELAGGAVPTTPGTVHIDCTARGLGTSPPTPVFSVERICIQAIQNAVLPLSAAIIGYLDVAFETDDEKNARSTPLGFIKADPAEIAQGILITTRSRNQLQADQTVGEWLARDETNPAPPDQLANPELSEPLGRLLEFSAPAEENLERILSSTPIG